MKPDETTPAKIGNPIREAPERRSSVWHTVHYKCTDCGYQSSAPAQVGEFTNCGNCGSTFLAPQTPAAAPAPQPAAGDEPPELPDTVWMRVDVLTSPELREHFKKLNPDDVPYARVRTADDRPAGEHPFGPCGYKHCDWPDGELRCNERPAAPPNDWARVADGAATNIETWLFEEGFPIVREQRESIAQIILTAVVPAHKE